MNTLMARLWILGAFAGLIAGFFAEGGVAPMLVMPLVGAMFGIVVAMVAQGVRGKFKKRT